MRKKSAAKTKLYKKWFLFAVIVQSVLQVAKNGYNAFHYLYNHPFELTLVLVSIIYLTVIIAVHKINYYNFGERIIILEILEAWLMLTALFCCIFVNDKGKFVCADDFDLPGTLCRMHIVFGIVSSYILSNFMYNALRREVNKEAGLDLARNTAERKIESQNDLAGAPC